MGPLNKADIEWEEHCGVDKQFKQKRLGEAAGSKKLGCTLYEIAVGGQPFSYHYHTANEEALYVLSGTGTLRLNGDTYPLRHGDYIACPANELGGHCVVNDSDDALRYLAFSTMNEPDVTVHPEIDKLGVYVGSPPGRPDERTLSEFFDLDSSVELQEDG